MAKNIVICCDGTGNEFGAANSNVVKLYQALEFTSDQIAYYHPGVGTMGARNALSGISKVWTRLIGLAFGYGVSDNIADAYEFLMHEFEPGDNVYVFGFSRGAYTARALCGMLHIIGLLTKGNEGLIPYAIRMIKSKNINFPVLYQFRKTFSVYCAPHFVGVWDTVSSLGWVYNSTHFPFTTTVNHDFQIVRHAISIDERRAFFRQNLFGKPQRETQDIQERWFAGVHSDVGGSYPEENSQLSKIALQWILSEAEIAGLKVNAGKKTQTLGGAPPNVGPDPLTKYQHESLHGFWWICELWPTITHRQDDQGKWKKSIRFNFGRRRWISPDAVFHESVEQRLAHADPPYRPGNLPAQPIFARDSGANVPASS